MTDKETYELVITQLLSKVNEIDFLGYYGENIDEMPTVLTQYDNNTIKEYELRSISLDNTSANSISIKIAEPLSNEDGVWFDTSILLPSEYEKIANIIHKCLFPRKIKILQVVDSTYNTKFPICICQINYDGTINKPNNVIRAVCETLNVEYVQAQCVINRLVKKGTNFAKIKGYYEVFFENCQSFID